MVSKMQSELPISTNMNGFNCMSVFFVCLSFSVDYHIKTHPIVINGYFSRPSFIILLCVHAVVLLRCLLWTTQAQCWAGLPLQVPVISPALYLFTQRAVCQHNRLALLKISYSKQDTKIHSKLLWWFSGRYWGKHLLHTALLSAPAGIK